MTVKNIIELESKIKEIIDDLKGLCSQNGLSNQAAEEKIITTIFLYKFLNDKFTYELENYAQDIGYEVEEVLNDEEELLDFYDYNSQNVNFRPEERINELVNRVEQNDFADQLDKALEAISRNPINERFSIETADGTKKPLFESVTQDVDASARNNFAKNIFSIIAQDKFDFSGAFDENFDFYSTIFEYLIKDYNVAKGKYAEYYTPASIASIIAKCLVNEEDDIRAAEIYDPSAGSGSLVLHLAHELGKSGDLNNAVVYTQDISNKSTRFLRLNLIINGMVESLSNIIQGDTLLNPAHYEVEGQASSGLKKFDYITSNPPFVMDFSTTRNDIEQKWQDTGRFFAGFPNIPKKDKDKMAIYTSFIQHILYSLKPNGKAAIVVPTGFLTAQTPKMMKTIRQKLIDEKMLKGVITMPSNIFANTGTNVSVLFIDKANTDGDVTLIDASKLGEKIKDGKNQKTILFQEEVEKIIDTFNNHEEVEDFSVNVSYDEIKEKGYSLSAGQYFNVNIDYIDITEKEFQDTLQENLSILSQISKQSQSNYLNIVNELERLSFNEIKEN